jgi:hypothetical protein
MQWALTGNRLLPWNWLLGLSFQAVVKLITTFTRAEGGVLPDKDFHTDTVSQLLEANDLTGRPTVLTSVTLLADLILFPFYSTKLNSW